MKHRTVARALLTLLVAPACATSRFDQHFEARRYAEAVETFQADSSLHHDEQALFRVALAYASPDNPVYRPARARQMLERLLLLFPESSHRAEARRLLALLDAVERLEALVARQRAEIDRERATIAELRQQIEQLDTRVERESSQSDLLHKIVERLESDLRERDGQLRALREELKRLKEVDLKPSSSGRSEPAATLPRDSAAPAGSAQPDTTRRG